MGGDFAPKMKWAGYDAIVVVGKSESPKYLVVSEDACELIDADQLWGLTTYQAHNALYAKHGNDAALAVIGPAGENRVRWSIIQSKTKNAAGQGGFGAVMGDKKLKAIVVKPGTQKVPIANPEKLLEEVVRVSGELSPAGQNRVPLVRDLGRYKAKLQSCNYSACTGGPFLCLPSPEGCTAQPTYFNKLPMTHTGNSSVSGAFYCASACGPMLMDADWGNTEKNFEVAYLMNELGLNHFEAFIALPPFFMNSYKAGKLKTLLGEEVQFSTDGPRVGDDQNFHAGMPPDFAVKFLRAVAYREGEGDIWAEGAPRAAEKLGLEDQVHKSHKHGYGPHWDGRNLPFVEHFPPWLVNALSWAVQGKDPIGQQHDYGERYPSFVAEWETTPTGQNWYGGERVSYAEMCKAGAKLYGVEHANEGWDKPELGYTDKEYVAVWHDHRAAIKSSLVVCDRVYPMLYDTSKEDNLGDYEAEVRLFNAVVGTSWTLDDMHKAAERIFNLMRAIHVRQGRTRADDESVIPYFEQQGYYPDETRAVEPAKFRELLDRLYALRGWDKATGWPTRQRLEALGMEDVAKKLEALGKLP
jgi:aldehyde:ferredoxin oxidoreductase